MATIEELYQQLGQAIANAIPEPWESAKVRIEFGDSVINMQASFKPANDQPEKSFVAGRIVRNTLKELRQALLAAGQPKWDKAVYTLQAGGSFDLSFEY